MCAGRSDRLRWIEVAGTQPVFRWLPFALVEAPWWSAVHEGVRPARCCDLWSVLEAQADLRSHPDGRYTG